VERRKCLIDRLNWTKGVGGEEEVSNRQALLDKTGKKREGSVQ
jgi:hypothetical protein